MEMGHGDELVLADANPAHQLAQQVKFVWMVFSNFGSNSTNVPLDTSSYQAGLMQVVQGDPTVR